MLWLTQDARLRCDHGGRVSVAASQQLVRIETRRVLVHPNPEGRSIAGCPANIPLAGILPCRHTQEARQGYSELVRIDGEAVCLASILGYTDGSPPRVVNYKVADPGQTLVEAAV